jgi:hypothetical protein
VSAVVLQKTQRSLQRCDCSLCVSSVYVTKWGVNPQAGPNLKTIIEFRASADG